MLSFTINTNLLIKIIKPFADTKFNPTGETRFAFSSSGIEFNSETSTDKSNHLATFVRLKASVLGEFKYSPNTQQPWKRAFRSVNMAHVLEKLNAVEDENLRVFLLDETSNMLSFDTCSTRFEVDFLSDQIKKFPQYRVNSNSEGSVSIDNFNEFITRMNSPRLDDVGTAWLSVVIYKGNANIGCGHKNEDRHDHLVQAGLCRGYLYWEYTAFMNCIWNLKPTAVKVTFTRIPQRHMLMTIDNGVTEFRLLKWCSSVWIWKLVRVY
ncbi:hypothetical protein RND81_02G213900 [Saponaria officinalis]|uniref:Uncharacterized protein n=1 Tax=Saponaria officinalis TaxID=3572 RepID=A0AAW1MWA2_SAPOF